MTRAGSGSAKRSDSGQGNIKNFFAKKAAEPETTKEASEVSANGDAVSEAKAKSPTAKSPGQSPGKTSDYESEVSIAGYSNQSLFDVAALPILLNLFLDVADFSNHCH